MLLIKQGWNWVSKLEAINNKCLCLYALLKSSFVTYSNLET
jgi:hypothetical protein